MNNVSILCTEYPCVSEVCRMLHTATTVSHNICQFTQRMYAYTYISCHSMCTVCIAAVPVSCRYAQVDTMQLCIVSVAESRSVSDIVLCLHVRRRGS